MFYIIERSLKNVITKGAQVDKRKGMATLGMVKETILNIEF